MFPSSRELDLLDKKQVEKFLFEKKPSFIFMLAGFVGGILKNSHRQAEALYKNSVMILNLLEGIKLTGRKPKLLYTGSTCIYPKENPQPINESRFLAGELEPSNIGYAIAKLTGIVACQKYREQHGIKAICAMPTNLYGIGDNYHPSESHFLAALIRKFLLAKENNDKSVVFWGSGEPRREALYSDDCAEALVHLMQHYDSSEIINVGTGKDYSIKEYVAMMAKVTEYEGGVVWDKSKPDGTFAKKTDIGKLRKVFPDFAAREFNEGVLEILNNPAELKRILS